MPNKTWNIALDNQSHKVEFKHSSITHKRSIFVDGMKIELPKEQRRIQWDTGTKHKFDVSGHECLIATRSSGFDFIPELYIDGKNAETGLPIVFEEPTKVSDEAVRKRRIGVVVIMLVIGIGSLLLNGRILRSSGGYFPFLSLLGPALLVVSGYYAIFPDDPWVIPKPIPFRLIAMLILAFGLGIANLWATENGLYYLLFS